MPTLKRTHEGVGDTESVFGGQRWATIKEELRQGEVLVLQGPKKLSLEGVYLDPTFAAGSNLTCKVITLGEAGSTLYSPALQNPR